MVCIRYRTKVKHSSGFRIFLQRKIYNRRKTYFAAVCARARACVCVYVCMCVYVCVCGLFRDKRDFYRANDTSKRFILIYTIIIKP